MPDTKGYILYDNFLAKTELQGTGKEKLPQSAGRKEGENHTTALQVYFSKIAHSGPI